MTIKKLRLVNFRNYEDETFSFEEGLNVLSGRNAQGKTNCAEAVFYLTTGSPFRSRHEKRLVRFGQECARLEAEAYGKYGKILLEAEIGENGRKFFINRNEVSRLVDFMGHMNGVFFSPSELRLIQEGPDERRRFLNISISQTSKSYCSALIRYTKILDQRNALLKERDVSEVLSTLSAWDEQLATYAARIEISRREFLSRLTPLAAAAHAFLTDGEEELLVRAEKSYEGDEEAVKEQILRELNAANERDLRFGFTTVGPHREDLKIQIDGTDARHFASQGQTRTAALSMKLAEVEIFKEITGESPVLILDDVLSELDLPRRKKLVERAQGGQCILTCTHAERVLYGKDTNKIKIQGGKIVK